MKILIVEDEVTDRLMLRSAVQHLGHECVVAASGRAGWDLFNTHQPDVVISDWRMPGVDGVELCRRIRASEWSTYTPFIFVTGLTDREHALEALELGADDCLVKPLDINELRARLMAAARLKRAEARVIEQTRALQALADTDPLTELANRRQATEVLKRYLSLARRRGHQVSLAVVDIDHFKDVNDSYGHPAGDAVLQGLANVLTQTFREEDVVARWGGDEFVVGLYDTPPGTAMSRLAELLAKVRETHFTAADGRHFSVTLSAGLAEYPDDGHDLLELFGSADAALYRAKGAGRDCLAESDTRAEPFAT
jgi:diguanylate cyclase (GGDEF)-like protein